MSIKPVSDIVLDVARAADPAKSSAAMERLARLGSAEQSSDSGFSTILGATELSSPTTVAQADLRDQLAVMGAKSAGMLAPEDARTKAYKGLEQLVLQKLVETMLPKDGSEIFGHGAAGDIWRSMLAEQLAAQIGKTVDLGLFKATSARASSVATVGQADSVAGATGLPGSAPIDQRS